MHAVTSKSLSSFLDFDADTSSNSLSHVTDCEPSERSEVLGGLDDERLGGLELDDCVVTVLQEAEILELLSCALCGDNLDELACNLSGVNVEDRGVSDGHDGGVVQDDDLCSEGLSNRRRVVNRSCDVSPLDLVLCDSTDVESNVVSGDCLGQLLVVHLDGLDLTSDVGRHEDDLGLGLEDSGLDTSDRNGSNSSDGVDILDREPECLVGLLCGDGECIECLDEGGSLVPGGVSGCCLDVVSGVCGNGDEGDVLCLW